MALKNASEWSSIFPALVLESDICPRISGYFHWMDVLKAKVDY
jgi:hypothetical protein